jgi:RNA polymerase sigma-70 factor (ECF subfamily)
LSRTEKQLNDLVKAGAERLLARAANRRALEPDALVARVRSSVEKYVLKHDPEAASGAIASFIDGLHADDLCLVTACQRGDQPAWNELVEGYGATVRSAARSASPNEEMADDLAQSIWAELHGLKEREDGQPAGKLSYYSGAGSLGGWLRAVVGQLAIDRHRREARLVHTEEDSELDRIKQRDDAEAVGIFHVSANPEEALSQNLAAAAIERALTQALARLDDEDRLLVKLYYFDGMRLKEAGAVLGVHEATASRRLTRIHGEVRKEVEALLIKEHGWTKTEAAKSLSQVATSLQMEVEPLLASTTTPAAETPPAGDSVVV